MRLGILLSRLAGNQLGYSLVEAGAAAPGVDLVAFVQNTSRPHRQPPFAAMSLSEAYDFKGVAVATSVSTAFSLLRFPGPSARFFYVWDPEWLRSPGLPYETLREVYRNPRLPLIARSASHRDLIEGCWNTEVHAVVGDGDLPQLIESTLWPVNERRRQRP